MSFFLLSFQTSLAGSTISPINSHEALIGPMTYPSVVQVSVDVHAVHPSGHTSVLGGCQRVSLVVCWTGVHSTLCVVAWRCLGIGCPLEPTLDFEC